MKADLSFVGGVAALVIALVVGIAEWLTRATAKKVADSAKKARIRAEEHARDVEQRSARAQVAALAEAAHERAVAEEKAEEKAANVKASIAVMGDDEAINAAAELARKRGW